MASLHLAPDQIALVTAGLRSGIDVDGGPTDEQRSVLRVLTAHLWGRPDIDPERLPRIGPQELANRLTEPDARTAFHELLLALEACRHPQTEAQVAVVEEYAAALEVEDENLGIFRDLVTEGIEAARADFRRFMATDMRERFEPALADMPVDPQHPEIALAEKLGTFAEYAPGTLGRAYLSFYERFGLTLPGVNISANHHFFVAHDMTHTIAGISTTSPGEIALSAFQFAMDNNRINRAALLASLIVHEAGFAVPDHLMHGESGLLAEQSSALLLAQELKRGSQCRADFSLVDHFELAPLPLAEVRAEFGVQPPVNPQDGHHW